MVLVRCKLAKIGNSRGVIIPHIFIRTLSLEDVTELNMIIEDDSIILRRITDGKEK